MPVDRGALQDGLRHLGTLDRDMEVEALLADAIHGLPAILDVSGAGFFMIDAHNVLRSVAASDRAGKVLEDVQTETGEGPCIDAFVTDCVVGCADVGPGDRYPTTGPRLAAEGVRAVMAVPVRLGGGPIGCLDCYLAEPYEWSGEDHEAVGSYGQLLSHLLCAALAARRHSELAEQLQYALDHRVLIERAVGYVMASRQIDAVAAFNELRRAARNSRRRVAAVAADVLDGVLPV
jgi:GAF domain-containing protein